MNDLKEALNALGWLDFIFLIPMFLLYSYLPIYNFASILLNIVIVILCSFGLALLAHLLWNYLKEKRDK